MLITNIAEVSTLVLGVMPGALKTTCAELTPSMYDSSQIISNPHEN